MDKRGVASNRNVQRFLEDAVRLEAVEFIGVAKILGVPLLEKKNAEAEETVRPMDIVLDEVAQGFSLLKRSKRRELERIVRAASRRSESK